MNQLPEQDFTQDQLKALERFHGGSVAIHPDGRFIAPDGFADEVTAEQMARIAPGVYRIGRDPDALPERNPWAKGSINMTEQGKYLRENPELAKRLKDAAI